MRPQNRRAIVAQRSLGKSAKTRSAAAAFPVRLQLSAEDIELAITGAASSDSKRESTTH